jgi:hypothetical protein
MEGKVRCTVVTPTETREIRLESPFSKFNAEAEAINAVINMTKISEKSKRVILTDSLSCLTALNEIVRTHKTLPDDWVNWIKKSNMTSKMGIIGNLDGDIETTNKKKQKHTNTHEERTGDSFEPENGLHTRLTYGLRVDLVPSPECGDCGCRLTMNHILWDALWF